MEALAEAQQRAEWLAQIQARAEGCGRSLLDHGLEWRYTERERVDLIDIVRRPRALTPIALVESIDDAAADAGWLIEPERKNSLFADLAVEGRRYQDGAALYVLLKIRDKAAPDHLQRAADRATTLAKLGRPVIPAVAGRAINPAAAELTPRPRRLADPRRRRAGYPARRLHLMPARTIRAW